MPLTDVAGKAAAPARSWSHILHAHAREAAPSTGPSRPAE